MEDCISSQMAVWMKGPEHRRPVFDILLGAGIILAIVSPAGAQTNSDPLCALPARLTGAAAVLEEQLKEHPNDLLARWLVNIAYMTLGNIRKRSPSNGSSPLRFLIPTMFFLVSQTSPDL